MMILNLVVIENSEVKEVISSTSQSRLLKRMRELEMVGEEMRMNDIPNLMNCYQEVFKDTKFEGSRMFLTELISG